ncbi:ABC transporter permease [Amycolatopsis magusensis]|uniref:ABC-2 type transport system permease protein n=1 Tax=Amycolatopsis magusensis TaxID=882444 RepID=A0ABS4PU31_9PSEU|nr:ABC-2 family transporter protein [Amycolatopsis magusensis]MBP2182931.1 ABC-2 type transport system permease protein [Amycolatopsis magusensis]
MFRYWWSATRAALRAEAQYRANFVVSVIASLCYQGVGLASIGVVLSTFETLGGWTLPEVAFLYGLRLTAHGLWVVLFSQLLVIDQIVREGHFDRFLVRPGNPLVHLMTHRTALTPVGDLLGGLVLLAVVMTLVPVNWSLLGILYLIAAVVGGALTELSLQLAASSLTFRTLSSQALRVTIDTIFGTFGNYPTKIFSAAARFALTFLLPLAFVAYLPGAVLLDKAGELHVPAVVGYAAPAVGVVLFAAAYAVWRRQLRHYQSGGH